MATKKRKKIVDKWKMKKWYEIVAPSIFDNKLIGETMAEDESKVIDRILKINLRELVKGGMQAAMFTKVHLRVHEIKGKTAYTRYIGHQMDYGYMRTLARRGRSVIDVVMDGKTKDEQILRIKVVAVTGSKVSENTKKNIRAAIKEEIKKVILEYTLEDAIKDILQGRVSGKIYNKLKEITVIRKVEVSKSRVKEVFK